MKRPKRPGDFAQVAKLVVDIATGTATDAPAPPKRKPAPRPKQSKKPRCK
jgi:hypothetical protein